MRRSAFPLRVPLALATAAAAAVRRWQQTINVPVMLSTAIVTPIVIGLWRPMVIFPAAMVARMSVADFELILLHELAHIVRRDAWVNAMQVVLEILLFYHPVVHWLSRRTRLERECACDDFAVQASGSAYEYARALASLGVGGGSVFALSLGAAGGDLLPRLRNLAGEPAEDEGFLRSPANFAVLLALLLCLIWIRPQLNVQWHPSETLGALRVADAPEALSVSSASSRHRTPETQREVSPPALTPAEALTSPPAAAPRRMRPARQTRQARPSPDATLTGSTSAGATASVDRGVAPPDAEPNRAELTAISGHAANDTLPAANETLPVLTPVYSPAPAYPLRARLDGIEGTVQVGLRIGADGRPTGLQIVDARPLGVFEGAVRQALMKWRYEVSDAGKSSRELTAFYRLSFSLSGVTSATTSICATATASRTCRAP